MKINSDWLQARCFDILQRTGIDYQVKRVNSLNGPYEVYQGASRITGGTCREVLCYLDGIMHTLNHLNPTPSQTD